MNILNLSRQRLTAFGAKKLGTMDKGCFTFHGKATRKDLLNPGYYFVIHGGIAKARYFVAPTFNETSSGICAQLTSIKKGRSKVDLKVRALHNAVLYYIDADSVPAMVYGNSVSKAQLSMFANDAVQNFTMNNLFLAKIFDFELQVR